jgi:hypothetical protein
VSFRMPIKNLELRRLLYPIERGLKSKIFLKNDPIKSNGKHVGDVIFCVKTLLFLQKVWYRIIEDKESTYFEKGNMQKFDFAHFLGDQKIGVPQFFNFSNLFYMGVERKRQVS